MNKNKSVRFAACVAAVLAALSLCAAELAHRLGFNGDNSGNNRRERQYLHFHGALNTR